MAVSTAISALGAMAAPDLVAAVGWEAALAFCVMTESLILTEERIEVVLNWCREQGCLVDEAKKVPVVTFTADSPSRGNQRKKGVCTLEWHWIAGPRALAIWRAGPAPEQGWREPLAAWLGVAAPDVVGEITRWLAHSGCHAPATVACAAADSLYVGPIRAMWDALWKPAPPVYKRRRVPSSSRKQGSQQKDFMAAVRRALKSSEVVDALDEVATTCGHDGTVAICVFLTHRIRQSRKRVRCSSLERYFAYVAPLTAADFFDMSTMTRQQIFELLPKVMAEGVETTVTYHHRDRHIRQLLDLCEQRQQIVSSGLQSDDQDVVAEKNRGDHVRATILGEHQWQALLSMWCEQHGGWYGAAGVIYILLCGRLGLRREEARHLRLCDVDDHVLRVKPYRTMTNAGVSSFLVKTPRARRRLCVAPLLTAAEHAFWTGYVRCMQAIFGKDSDRPLLKIGEPRQLGDMTAWLGARLDAITGLDGGGTHRLRHQALTRLRMILMEPPELAARFCSLSVEALLARRNQLLNGGRSSPQAVWRQYSGHSDTGLSGFDYWHGQDLVVAWRLYPQQVVFPKPGPAPIWPKIAPTPIFVLPLLALYRQGGCELPVEPELLEEWRQRAERLVTHRRTRGGGKLFALDGHPTLPLPTVTSRIQQYLEHRLCHYEAIGVSAPDHLFELCRHLSSVDRPGFHFRRLGDLKRLWPFLCNLGMFQVVVDPDRRGQRVRDWRFDGFVRFEFEGDDDQRCTLRLQPALSYGVFACLNALLWVLMVWHGW